MARMNPKELEALITSIDNELEKGKGVSLGHWTTTPKPFFRPGNAVLGVSIAVVAGIIQVYFLRSYVHELAVRTDAAAKMDQGTFWFFVLLASAVVGYALSSLINFLMFRLEKSRGSK